MALLFDIEADDLWPKVSEVWCLVTVDSESGEINEYSDHDDGLPSLQDGLDALYQAKTLAGHNICGYDLMVLEYLFGWTPNPETKLLDTWVMSQMQNMKRSHKHGLEGWGEFLGFPKIEFNDFTKYSKVMLKYCRNDVLLNVKVYKFLVEEAKKLIAKNPLFSTGLFVENMFALLEGKIRMAGWTFDMKSAVKLLKKFDKELRAMEDEIEPDLGLVCVPADSRKEFKEPKWKKDGSYFSHVSNHFDIDPLTGRNEKTRLVVGPYCRIGFEECKLSSLEGVKAYLYTIGWKPDEWNTKKVNGNYVNTTPKLTETSLLPLGPIGVSLNKYYSIKNRRGILAGWIAECESHDGNLHGRMWTLGTPTFRCRHEVVANLPSIDALYGKEMRALLTSSGKDRLIVGADSAGNQMRGLCHYIGDDDFTNEVINGDVHTKNANILSGVYPCERKTAKPWLYAYLFGAGAGKSGKILTGKTDAKIGKASQELFETSIPGLKELKDGLKNLFERTCQQFGKDKGFIIGIDGRRIFVGSAHQLLNYLLQTLEGITCKAALVYAWLQIQEEGLDAYPVIHYHDECAFDSHKDDAERVKEILVESFCEAPKWFGVECMNGEGKIGINYSEVH